MSFSIAARAEDFHVLSVFPDYGTFKNLMKCVECRRYDEPVLILKCLHLICYGPHKNCLGKIRHHEFPNFFVCKLCHQHTTQRFLDSVQTSDWDSAAAKLHNNYIFAARQVYLQMKTECELPVGCSSTLEVPPEAKERSPPVKSFKGAFTTMRHKISGMSPHQLKLNRHMLIQSSDDDQPEVFCNRTCVDYRATKLGLGVKHEQKYKDFVTEWPEFSSFFLQIIQTAPSDWDEQSKNMQEKIHANFNLLQEVYRITTNTLQAIDDIGKIYPKTGITLEHEQKRNGEVGKLASLCALGQHLILQEIMLYRTYQIPRLGRIYLDYYDEQLTDCDVVKEFLNSPYQRMFDTNWNIKNYDSYILVKPAAKDKSTKSEDLYYICLPTFRRNYREMTETAESYFFPGLGPYRRLGEPGPDDVRVVVQKGQCDCSTPHRTHTLTGAGNVQDLSNVLEGMSFLRKQQSNLHESFRIWLNEHKRTEDMFYEISDGTFLRTRRSDQNIVLGNKDGLPKQYFGMFDQDKWSENCGRGIWYHTDGDCCFVFILIQDTKQIAIYDFAIDFGDNGSRTFFAHQRSEVITLGQASGDTPGDRPFSDDDTLAVVEVGGELRLYICYNEFSQASLDEKKGIHDFLRTYTMDGKRLETQFSPASGFEGCAAPVLLGISKDGSRVIILDEKDRTWLYVFYQSQQARMGMPYCMHGWTRLQIQEPFRRYAAVDILDAFLASEGSRFFLHYTSLPLTEEGAEKKHVLMCNKLDVTELMQPQNLRRGVDRPPSTSRSHQPTSSQGATSQEGEQNVEAQMEQDVEAQGEELEAQGEELEAQGEELEAQGEEDEARKQQEEEIKSIISAKNIQDVEPS